MSSTELQTKQNRLADFLDRHALDGVLLTQRNNFAWITCGRDNHIANNTPLGVVSILATRDTRVCLANAIEAPRMHGEELVGTGIDTIDFPWWDPGAARRVVGDVIAGRKVACDAEAFGLPLPPLPEDYRELRWSLTPAEVDRYRDGAQRTSRATEAACQTLKPGMTGHEIAGVLDHCLRSEQTNPVVTLVAVDDKIASFRHPIPKNLPARKMAMLVTCAEFGGLISCLTRFVHFGPLSSDQKAKQQAVCNIDAAVNVATRPGRTLGEIFTDLQQAYADNGHAGQWELHHQGGSTGYAGREVIAIPGSAVTVREQQAFAWNPSIVGAKSEDTVLVGNGKIEVLTAASEQWPQVVGHARGEELRRPDVLVL